ncbi:BtaA family protein [Candidatus Saccharibacteria bacterium]|nr:BtaA family protein [Candidatus Saccharibacteria bacterium]
MASLHDSPLVVDSPNPTALNAGGGLSGDSTPVVPPNVRQTQIYLNAGLDPNREISVNYEGQVIWSDEGYSAKQSHFIYPWTNEALTDWYDRLKVYLAGKKVVAVCNSDFVLTAVMAGAEQPVRVIDNNLASLFFAELKAVAASRLDRLEDFKRFFKTFANPSLRPEHERVGFFGEVFEDLSPHLSDHSRGYLSQVFESVYIRKHLISRRGANNGRARNAPYLQNESAYSSVRLASSRVEFCPESIEQFFGAMVLGRLTPHSQCDTAYLSNAPAWISLYGWGSDDSVIGVVNAVSDGGHVLIATDGYRQEESLLLANNTGARLTRIRRDPPGRKTAFNEMSVFYRYHETDLLS